jgi:hypothetical protein
LSITGTTVTHNQRWIDLEGADNTRDLGGLAVAGGRRIRFRRLLRAGTLQDLTAGDVAYLTEELGVRTVVDLRFPLFPQSAISPCRCPRREMSGPI